MPSLQATTRSKAQAKEGVVFAVYAPFGTDETLSRYPLAPGLPQKPIRQQPMVLNLQKVAALGVNVSALVDLFEDDSYLVEIPAGCPKDISITSAWKQDMSAPQALAGFLRRVGQRFPGADLVLAIEGHGGGFVPDIDAARITPASQSRWKRGGQSGSGSWIHSETDTRFAPDAGSPALPMDIPALPMDIPALPGAHMPMSTWALAQALKDAIKSGAPRPAVIHFNNCFNASFELLHTVAPYADVATGYANYDFFTAGNTYPGVFEKLRLAGSASREQLARWFALANQAELAKQPGHPTVGAVVPLSALRRAVTPALDALAQALTAELRAVTGPARVAVRDRIQAAAVAAQHYDTAPGLELQVPDQFMDIGSFAKAVQTQFPAHPANPANPVNAAAGRLLAAVTPFKAYGDVASPLMANNPAIVYDFQAKELGLNIFFPDPELKGNWDWRSPFYLSGKVDLEQPPAHRHVIDFLADGPGGTRPAWVSFIEEYHKAIHFVGFLAIQPLLFPLFNPPKKADPNLGQPDRPKAPRNRKRK